MAYAFVLSTGKRKTGKKGFYRFFQAISGWFKGFIPAPVQVSFKKVDQYISFYIIKMPLPEIFQSKNSIGKRKTIKKWLTVINDNKIDHYLLDRPLKEYLNSEWSVGNEDYLADSLRGNAYLFFEMEPLRPLAIQTMTIALSGVQKENLTSDLISVLKNFKVVNVIDSECDMKYMWDEFMTETGVPVCITNDTGVLSRSHLWVSYRGNTDSNVFSGVKVDFVHKRIIYPKTNKQYQIGYALGKNTMKKLGKNLIRKFHQQMLIEFLMHMLINENRFEPSKAEEILGIRITILSVKLYS